jgi:hypothetical protein
MRRSRLAAAFLGLVLACKPAAAQNVTLARLWAGYPAGNPSSDPGHKFGDNQFSIRLSLAVLKAGADRRSFAGMAAVAVGGKTVATRAGALAAWLHMRRAASAGCQGGVLICAMAGG